jgi:glycosyltransferase involved in cell wall biosynthesis
MPEKKRIALCLEYPLELRGGVSVLVETLIQGLEGLYEVVLVSPDSREKTAHLPLKGHIPWEPGEVSPKTSLALAQELARQGVHLAHFHSGGNFGWGCRFPGHSPIVKMRSVGIPCCTSVHLVVSPLDGYCGPQKPLWFKVAMMPLAHLGKMQTLAHVRGEIAVSRHDAQKLRRWYGFYAGKITQLYHSRLQMPPPDPNPAGRDPVILNVGHIAWRKGQLVLAEGFAKIAARHPEWNLNLVGGWLEPEIIEKIKALAKTQGLESRILLPGERTDTSGLMKRAGIYVQPSFHEALGLALQEAMFLGCPSIAMRAGGMPELVENEKTGLLVDAGNVDQLAQALERFISNYKLRADMGRAAAASIVQKGMTQDQMIAAHARFYESIFRQT